MELEVPVDRRAETVQEGDAADGHRPGRSSGGRRSRVAASISPTSIMSQRCVLSLSRNAVSFMTSSRSNSTIF